MTIPKVFLSHASEDKERFVNKFAARLRDNGVEAWLDKWEMLPGDSLVDKIFEEGLKEADAIIIILSKNSVKKPWVKEELNASFIKRIEKGTRLIPLIIDECDAPEALKTTLWESIKDLSNYDKSFERILASIFSHSMKPKLGKPPTYSSSVLSKIDGIEVVDNLILKQSCEYLLKKPDDILDPYKLFGVNNPNAPPKSEVLESIDILDDKDYFHVSRFWGGGPENWGCSYRVSLFGFEEYCKAYVPNYGQIVDKCAGLIVNENAKTNYVLRDTLGIPLMVANHIIRLLEYDDYVKVSGEIGERISIYEVSSKLRRALK